MFISSEIEDVKKFLTAAYTIDGYAQSALFFADGAVDQKFLDLASTFPEKNIPIWGTRPPAPSGALFDLLTDQTAHPKGRVDGFPRSEYFSLERCWPDLKISDRQHHPQKTVHFAHSHRLYRLRLKTSLRLLSPRR